SWRGKSVLVASPEIGLSAIVKTIHVPRVIRVPSLLIILAPKTVARVVALFVGRLHLAKIGSTAVVAIVIALDESVLLIGIVLTLVPSIRASKVRAGILHSKAVALVVGTFFPSGLTVVVPVPVIPIPIPGGSICD